MESTNSQVGKKATNMNSKVCLNINEISLINFSKYDHRVIE